MFTSFIPKRQGLWLAGNSIFNYGAGNINNQYAVPNGAYTGLTGKKPVVSMSSVPGRTLTDEITDFQTNTKFDWFGQGSVYVTNEITNTLNGNRDINATYALLTQLGGLVKAKGGIYIVGTMMSRKASDATYTAIETDRLAINQLIKNNPTQFDLIIDYGSINEFNGMDKITNTTYYNADQIHPAAAGYTLMINLTIPALNPLFP